VFIAGACFAAGYWLGTGDLQHTSSKKDVDAMDAHLAIKNAEIQLQLARIEKLQHLVQQWKDKANQGAHAKIGELSFYKDLPKQSVMPTPVSSAPVIKAASKAVVKPLTHSAAKTTNSSGIHDNRVITPAVHSSELQKRDVKPDAYRIQIASFRSRSDAAPMQQKLMQSGFPAFIHAVDLGAKGQWFRVYAGPFPSKLTAQSNQRQIEIKMKIKGLLLRER
jgi:cell division septation protein DedD